MVTGIFYRSTFVLELAKFDQYGVYDSSYTFVMSDHD